MAEIFDSDVITYACACGHLNPIAKLFFCRHCLKLRCGFCVSHEVDSHFCCICMENIPSSEAKLKKYRCNKCFECPVCQHTLSARGTTIQVARPDTGEKKDDETGEPSVAQPTEAEKLAKMSTKKMYYLSCLACRWTSRDVGLPDQSNATANWPEIEYAHTNRFNMLTEYYQNIVLLEKQEKQDYMRRMAPKKHKFPSLTDRTGITASMVRRQMGWSDKLTPKKNPKISASIASDKVEGLPKDIFMRPVDLKAITTLKQRLQHPATQPLMVKNLYPQHKNISIKRSLRCKQCEHNVIKPEFNPPSIKYRIQLFASAHMPEVRLVKVPKIIAGQSFAIQLKLTNPTLQDMTITLLNLPSIEEETLKVEEMRKNFDKTSLVTTSATTTPTSSLISTPLSLSRQTSLIAEELRPVGQITNANLLLPESSFVVNYRDDTAEFDDVDQIKREEEKFIVWRKSNRLVIELIVNPISDLIKLNDDIVVGFTMQYTYVNTVASATAAEGSSGDKEKHVLNVNAYARLGPVQET